MILLFALQNPSPVFPSVHSYDIIAFVLWQKHFQFASDFRVKCYTWLNPSSRFYKNFKYSLPVLSSFVVLHLAHSLCTNALLLCLFFLFISKLLLHTIMLSRSDALNAVQQNNRSTREQFPISLGSMAWSLPPAAPSLPILPSTFFYRIASTSLLFVVAITRYTQ